MMGSILQSLPRTLLLGIFLLIVMILVVSTVTYTPGFDYAYAAFFLRWLHVLSGIMWIGLLWYFNFVQIPNMGQIPDDQKPAISKVIAPAALFWFRWAAIATLLTGLLLAWVNGYLVNALTLSLANDYIIYKDFAIGIGMWLGIIMAVNVWHFIWPNQKKALGIVQASPEEKAAAARTAMLFSRTNTALSIPMLYAMVAAQNLY